jgi:hypothetical protein
MSRCSHQWLLVDTGPTALPVCTLCGRQPTASPSQVETWRDCQRKWAYSRIRPRKFNASAAFGERGHTVAEDWLRDGKPPDANTPEGRCILTGIALLPPPRPATPDLMIEHRPKASDGGPVNLGGLGIGWDMRLDFVHSYVPGVSVTYGDHKTTGDIAENAKTPEVLTTIDPQGIAYGHWAAETFDVPVAHGHWNYYQRDAKVPARAVTFTAERAHLAQRFREMHEREVLPMVRARALPPEALPRTLSACTKYGGCDYQAECLADVSPLELAAASLEKLRGTTPAEQDKRTLERLRATDTMTILPNDLAAAIAANKGALPQAPAPVAAPSALDAYLATLTPEVRAATLAAMAAAGTTPSSAAPAPAVPPQALPITAPPVVDVPALPQSTATPPVVTASAEPAPKKRGRPRKDATVATAPEPKDAEAPVEDLTACDVAREIRDEVDYYGIREHRVRLIDTWLRTPARTKDDLDHALELLAGA